jgi:putative transposase
MGFKYRIDTNSTYFLTTTVVDWIDVFTRKELAMVIVDDLNYCCQNKGLQIYAWCLMPRILHNSFIKRRAYTPIGYHAHFKKFTSKKVVDQIQNIHESRKEWMLNCFEFAGRFNPKIKEYKFWQDCLYPIQLSGNEFTDQKVNYIHQNPVTAGIVYRAEDYVWSSATAYAGELPALIEVDFIY